MLEQEIAAIVEEQRRYFKTHATFDASARKAALRALLESVRAHEDDIAAALYADLGKSHSEAYKMCIRDRFTTGSLPVAWTSCSSSTGTASCLAASNSSSSRRVTTSRICF